MNESSVRLIDLRTDFQPGVLDRLIALYHRSFTIESEKEDPAEWAERLKEEPRPPQPLSQILVAVKAGPSPEVLGGAVFEYYRESQCALLSYLMVDESARGQGVARLLVNAAIAKLEDVAKQQGVPFKMLFAETEDPDQVPEEGPMNPRERLQALAALGAMKVEVPYVQPEVKPGSGAAYHLMLISFGEPGRSFIDAQLVTDFLHEMYRGLGILEPTWDLDYLKTMRAIQDQTTQGRIPLKPLN